MFQSTFTQNSRGLLALLIFALFAPVSGAWASSEDSAHCLLLLLQRKVGIAHPEVPSVSDLRLPRTIPTALPTARGLSAGLTDPLLESVREKSAVEDFKPLSDATPRKLSIEELQEVSMVKLSLKEYVERAYDFSDETLAAPGIAAPRWTISGASKEVTAAVSYVEHTWTSLVRTARPREGGSLIDLPYPFLIPAGRFREAYYWDTFFGVQGLLATGRLELAQMQAENLLSLVRRFGMVPNGTRDYYLSRSQPPVLTTLVRDIYTHSPAGPQKRRWLKERAYPLMRAEYETFWMNPATRFDAKTGLNHHWDEINLPRPERHAADNEATLQRTYRDVRAAAESGLDFTDAFQGETTQVAGVLLNSLMYKTELDLAWAARESGFHREARKYELAAKRRRRAMQKYLWDARHGRFENYNLRTGRRIPLLTADTFAPLYVGMATMAQAKQLRGQFTKLERKGGLMSSELLQSHHQWDGTNGWAPQQMIAIEGLRRYGFEVDAKRLARKWVDMITKVHSETGLMFERMDVERLSPPAHDGSKYPTQAGFLWTNASYIWALTQVLGYRLLLLP